MSWKRAQPPRLLKSRWVPLASPGPPRGRRSPALQDLSLVVETEAQREVGAGRWQMQAGWVVDGPLGAIILMNPGAHSCSAVGG